MPYKNKEQAIARSKRYYQVNKDRVTAYQKEYKKRFTSQDNRNNYLWYEYGLTQADYDAIADRQNNCCALCFRHVSELHNGLHIDHDHDTGEVRGLLCMRCNTALGILGDNTSSIIKVLEYLNKDNINAKANS